MNFTALRRRAALALCGVCLTLAPACAPVDALNTLTPKDGYSVRKDLSYGALPAHTLDIYTPDAPKAGAPIVMFFYGGGWNSGTKDIYKFMGQAFADAGFVTLIPNYRVHPEVNYPDFVADAAKAVAWAKANYDAPIVLVGHSAGAHIASLLAVNPKYLAAEGTSACAALSGWVGLAGPYDFKVYEEPYLSIFPANIRTQMLPITHAAGNRVPALLITGTADETVDPAQTTRMHAALKDKAPSAPVFEKYYEGVKHVPIMTGLSKVLRKDDSTLYRDVIDFVSTQTQRQDCQ